MSYALQGWVKLIICCGMTLWLCLPLLPGRHAALVPAALGRRRLWLLAVLALGAVVAASNFGFFHTRLSQFGWLSRGSYAHHWDLFHYYMGSKYFAEVGYTGLYEAAALADSEDARLLAPSDRVRSLRDYSLVSRESALRAGANGQRRFSPARWQSFKADLRYFQEVRPARRRELFARLLRDHGYNATPVGTATASLLSRLVPARQVFWLSLLDPALLLALFLVLARTHGRELALVALIFLGTESVASAFFWQGGCYLRFDWLACTVLALCAWRAGRPSLSGGLLAYATMVRLFPLFFVFGPAVRAAAAAWRTRRLPREHARLFGAFAVSALLLVAYSTLAGRGLDSWREHMDRMEQHDAVAADNHLGLTSALAQGRQPDAGRRSFSGLVYQHRRGLTLLLSLLTLGLAALIARRGSDEESFSVGVFLIFASLNLASYYYGFLILLVVTGYRPSMGPRARVELAGLFALQVVAHALQLSMLERDMARAHYLISIGLLVYFGLRMASALRARTPDPDRA